jgi:hypothetical protein
MNAAPKWQHPHEIDETLQSGVKRFGTCKSDREGESHQYFNFDRIEAILIRGTEKLIAL